MIKEIYNDIKSKIIAIPRIKYFGVWNQQDERGYKSAQTPAVFIEFNPIEWVDDTAYMQTSEDFTFTLHIVARVNRDNDLKLYELAEDIYKSLQDGVFSRLREIPDHSFQEIADHQIVFTGRVEDDSVNDGSYYDDKPDEWDQQKSIE